MINQLRHEACSGSIDDLAHVVSKDCLADCLTKASADNKPLIQSVETGILPNVDKHPPFRELMAGRHKAYMSIAEWIVWNIPSAGEVYTFLGEPVYRQVQQCLAIADWYTA